MRIVSGKLKGSALHFLKDKKTRPLKDLARESIFNLLVHSKKIAFQLENATVLDLYAGTGSFGLECLSRFASKVYFIEKDEEAIKILEKNIEKLKVNKITKIVPGNVFQIIEKQNIMKFKFDLIFCDPPFKDENIKKLIELIFSRNLLEKNGIIILHRNSHTKEEFPKYFKKIDERKYGISRIIFGKFLV